MRYSDLEEFIKKNNLLYKIEISSGIYGIVVDDVVVYVGQSINTYQRCSQHIYNIENAMLNQEKKYLLLLSAKLGGHKVDCITLKHCEEDDLTYYENQYIKQLDPCLNKVVPSGRRDISKMKIEDLLAYVANVKQEEENKNYETN